MKWLLIFVLMPSVFAQEVYYKSGENSGQGKVERLDRSEKFLEEVSKKINALETEVKSLKDEVADIKLKLNSQVGIPNKAESEVSP